MSKNKNSQFVMHKTRKVRDSTWALLPPHLSEVKVHILYRYGKGGYKAMLKVGNPPLLERRNGDFTPIKRSEYIYRYYDPTENKWIKIKNT